MSSTNFCKLKYRRTYKRCKKGLYSFEEICTYYINKINLYGLRSDLNCVLSINPDAISDSKRLDLMDKFNLPSCGTFSNKGIVPISYFLDSVGFFTKEVEDLCDSYKSIMNII